MLHILLMILKIIGIILLILLALIILVVAIILLVPIRYYANGSYDKDIEVKTRISWLLRLIYIKVTYDSTLHGKEQLHIVLRILGYPFYDNLRPKKLRKKKTKPPKTAKTVKDTPIIAEKSDAKNEIPRAENTIDTAVTNTEVSDETIIDKTVTNETVIKDAQPLAKDVPVIEINENAAPKDTKKISKIKQCIQFIKSIPERIKSGFVRIRSGFTNLADKIKSLAKKKDELLAIFYDTQNRLYLKKVKTCLLKIGRHILPRRLNGYLGFGFEDPSTTGYLLGVLSIFYPVYQDHLMLYPDFEAARLYGSITFRGRIRLAVLLVNGLKIILDRRFKEILKAFKNI